MTAQSKFAGIFASRQAVEDDGTTQEPSQVPNEAKTTAEAPGDSPSESPHVRRTRAKTEKREGNPTTTASEGLTEANGDELQAYDSKGGKVRGKRGMSGPSGTYTQVTAYIPKTVHRDVMKRITIARYDNPDSPDFSELVADLLQEWLEK